ncbi:hypothetical protein J7L00_01115 [Candidatus Bathyarchaeota archaeon]|nr:hypothetical protein [Candidatus Bathyarchaeota archaeon]
MEPQIIEMDGALRLEGAFLEKIFATYMLSKGETVVTRPATGEVQHDVLIERSDGFIFCECTGLADIGRGKIDRFYNDALMLHDELKRRKNKGLIEAWFVAAVHDTAWSKEAKERFEKAASSLREKIDAEVRLLTSDKLLLELVGSGVLGMRLIRDRVYWAGPEDLAIRYDPVKKTFEYSRCSEGLLQRLHETHFSLLPSFYWESYYRRLFEEAVKDKMELPLSVFTYYPEEGLRWRSLDDLVNCYEHYLKHIRRTYVLEKGKDFILEEYVSRKRNRYYTLHLFTLGEQRGYDEAGYVSSTLISSLKGRAFELIEDFKKANKVPAGERVSLVIVSASQYWTPQAWGAVPEVPTAFKEEVNQPERMPGNELVKRLLNKGVLGLKFRTKNQVTLVGPGIKAVRMTFEGLTFSDKPWYA